MSVVTLRPVDENLLPSLLEVAVAGTDPHEALPRAGDPGAWTAECREAFDDHYGAPGSYAILVDGDVAGAARLVPAEAPGAAEVTLWLTRDVRGKGHGTEALYALIEEARSQGITALIVETNTSNEAAV